MATCLSATLEQVFNVKALNYDAVLDVDKKIRDFVYPSHLYAMPDEPQTWSTNPAYAMEQIFAVCLRELSECIVLCRYNTDFVGDLLFLHRSYFVRAIKENPANPLQHAYSPSVLTVYMSANKLICCIRSVYAMHTAVVSRSYFFWSCTFSCCVSRI